MTRNIGILVLGLVLGVSLTIGHAVLADREEQDTALPLQNLRVFTEVFSRIKQDYVESVDDETLLTNAVRGMLSGLDPHSSYLDAEEFRELRVGTTGEFGGLGIEIGSENGFIKVIAPIDDTPAKRAGIQAGDLIIRLDGRPVKGMSLQEAVTVMRGEPGTDITLTIVRENQDKPLTVTITRDIIHVQSVKSRMLEPNFGYLRITQFQEKTGEALLRELEALQEENGDGLQGVVLDLRNNPGGVLDAAVAVSDVFLDEGLIVYTKGRVADAQLRFSATRGDRLKDVPIVVLINGGSASAAEIVAGALQDHRRAIVMGTPSFGKGSVQTILPLPDGSAIKLTTARYYTPDGRSIQAEGIEPDIRLARVRAIEMAEAGLDPLTEADLERHLENGQIPETDAQEALPLPAEDAADDEAADGKALVQEDYALHEALNLLKGLAILQRRGH